MMASETVIPLPLPFAPLTRSEIRATVQLLKSYFPEAVDLHFKQLTLREPPKNEALAYIEASRSGEKPEPIDRRSYATYYFRNTDQFYESVVNLTKGKVESVARLGANLHPGNDNAEMEALERGCLEDEGVKTALAKLQLPSGTVVVADPWIYGSNGIDDDERSYQMFLYARHPDHSADPDSNYYAHPLTICPVMTSKDQKVIRIDYLPTGADNTTKEPGPYTFKEPKEYMPNYHTLRDDLKPLNVVQPEGASFKVTETGETGHLIEWQKWSFRVGFNAREGLVLYDVRYDERSLFYRVALSEMSIPYADPRHPFNKKAAFDLGDGGAGLCANNLALGCDCLGSIYYLDGLISDDKGEPFVMPNAVCIHEQDGGINWKHTNFRTGKAAITRQRELVLQTILTVGNYEYILAYIFNQSADFCYEVRATGILSVQPVEDDTEVSWGTLVHPGVLAAHHQHIFSLRIDPSLDGQDNRLVYEEAIPMQRSEVNYLGNGYTTKETVVTTASGLDLDVSTNRTYKIQNKGKVNPVNGKPVAYKIHVPPFQPLVSDNDSFNYKRAEFADHNLYVTSYKDNELYAGGNFTNQSRGGTGVRSFASRADNVKDADIVVWVNFGINHVPRIEDFPVMPAEVLKVVLRPVNFFTENPALDVPPSTQALNKSTLLSPSCCVTKT